MDNIEYNRQIAFRWIEAFNGHDLEKLLALYAEDALHYSPKLKQRIPESNGCINGKPALRQWWEDAFKRIPSLHYQLENLVVDDQQLLMEYLRKADGEPDMMVAEILEIREGLIKQSRVYHG